MSLIGGAITGFAQPVAAGKFPIAFARLLARAGIAADEITWQTISDADAVKAAQELAEQDAERLFGQKVEGWVKGAA